LQFFEGVNFNNLIVSQFRNYSSLKMDLVPGLNVFTGPNGSGKTSILEAIHYLCMTRGFVSAGDKYALRTGESFFILEGMTDTQEWIKVTFMEGRGKKVFHDMVPVDKLALHIGRIPVVALLPTDTDLIREAAAFRRKYLDAQISQYDSDYLQSLVRYEHALNQRNAALQHFLRNGSWDREQLHIWETIMIPEGIKILQGRLDYLNHFLPIFRELYATLSGQKEVPDIVYETQLNPNTREKWQEALEISLDKERYSGRTGFGCQRDELKLLLNGELIRDKGSQGQQKSFVMALKLANFVYLKEKKNTWPILLLDDLFDKLDAQRVDALAGLLKSFDGAQVFITDTSRERLQAILDGYAFPEIQYYSVEQGKVS